MQKSTIEINLIEHEGKVYLDVASFPQLVQLLAKGMLPDVPPPPPPPPPGGRILIDSNPVAMLPDVPPPPPR